MGPGENEIESKKYLKFSNDRIDDQPEGKGDNFVRAESKNSVLDISEKDILTEKGCFYPLGNREDTEYF